MLVCLLTSLLCWQDPTPPPSPKDAPPAPVAKARVVEVLDDKSAKQVVAEFEKAVGGSASMADKNRALDRVDGSSHALLAKSLANVIEKDKSVVIRKRAAVLLRDQPKDDAVATMRRLIKSTRVRSHPGVLAEVVRGLSQCGYEPKLWPEIDDLFEVDYEAGRVPLHEALLDLITRHQEKQAIELLLRNLDEPTPENVHHADNPPQEYWEARWKAWSVWRSRVKDALFATTGQRFSTEKEARAWLEKNPLR
jgi:hypothetical protein